MPLGDAEPTSDALDGPGGIDDERAIEGSARNAKFSVAKSLDSFDFPGPSLPAPALLRRQPGE
jgi:hypothetical protein